MVAANINSEKIMIKIMVRGKILVMMIVILMMLTMRLILIMMILIHMMMTMRLILVMMIVILRMMMTRIGSRNQTNINSVKVMMMTMRMINDDGHDDLDDDKYRELQSDAVRPLFRVLTLVFEWWGRIELSRILSICQFLIHTFLLSIANFLFFSFFPIALLSGWLIFGCLWIFKKNECVKNKCKM